MTAPSLRKSRDFVFASSFALVLSGTSLLVGHFFSSPYVTDKLLLLYQGTRKVAGAAADELIVGAVALVGYLLQLLKAKNLLFYARLEIAFALSSCYIASETHPLQLSLASLSVFGASAYLLGRGFENRRHALKDKFYGEDKIVYKRRGPREASQLLRLENLLLILENRA